MIEYCPTHGPIVVSSAAQMGSRSQELTAAEILEETTLTRIPDAAVVPVTIVVERINTAARELARANPHPKGHSFVGIRFDALQHLTVVIARTQDKQRSLEEKDLRTTAQEEIKRAVDSYTRLSGLADRIRAGKAMAEQVFGEIRADADPARARQALLQKVSQRQSVHIGNEEIVSHDKGAANAEIDVPAADRYRLRMTVQSVNTDTGDVSCKLVGGDKLANLFTDSDIETRLLRFRVVDEALFVLASAQSVGASFDAVVSVRLVLSTKGFSYRCTLVRFYDVKSLASELKKAIENRYSRLDEL